MRYSIDESEKYQVQEKALKRIIYGIIAIRLSIYLEALFQRYSKRFEVVQDSETRNGVIATRMNVFDLPLLPSDHLSQSLRASIIAVSTMVLADLVMDIDMFMTGCQYFFKALKVNSIAARYI